MVILVSKERIEKYVREGWWDNKTLIGIFLDNVSRNPDRTAIVDPPNKEALVGLKDERITYRELKERVDRLSSFLTLRVAVLDNLKTIHQRMMEMHGFHFRCNKSRDKGMDHILNALTSS